MQVILKRLAVWSLEALTGAFLLGVLLGALTSPTYILSVLRSPNFLSLLPGVWALAFGVAGFLFIYGYYLTTALFGVVWRSRRPWVYPTIAATLFLAHTFFIFHGLGPDMSSQGKAMVLPFLAGGGCIVFGCALAGNWLLRKWIQPGSKCLNTPSHGIAQRSTKKERTS
jgi:hypothetical protein